MDKTVFISLPIEDLQTVIIDCVNSCLKNNTQEQTPTEQPDRWFDLTEFCNYIPDKPSKPTAYGWVHRGIVPNHRRGKKLYFLKSEIDDWLKSGKRKSNAEIEQEAEAYLSNNKKGLNNGK